MNTIDKFGFDMVIVNRFILLILILIISNILISLKYKEVNIGATNVIMLNGNIIVLIRGIIIRFNMHDNRFIW